MHKLVNKVSLVVLGIIAGVMISLNFSAIADKTLKDELPALPIEELRAFTQVFGRIKSDYVEQVDDKKLITEAINGMLVGLDPHSAYLDSEEYKELQIGNQWQDDWYNHPDTKKRLEDLSFEFSIPEIERIRGTRYSSDDGRWSG
jgi:C-terminal processing protease CtpA/Prc